MSVVMFVIMSVIMFVILCVFASRTVFKASGRRRLSSRGGHEVSAIRKLDSEVEHDWLDRKGRYGSCGSGRASKAQTNEWLQLTL